MITNGITRFRIDKQRHRQEFMSPNSGNYLHFSKADLEIRNNYQDIKRPLKINHSDLSFKGLSLGMYYKLNKTYSVKEFLEFSDKYIGKMGRELWDDITVKHAGETNKLIQVNGDEITIFKKTIPHLAWDNAIYVFKVLPGDLLNGMVSALGKIPPLKKWAVNTLERPFFKNIRQRSKLESKVNSLRGLITYRDIKLKDALNKKAKDAGVKVSDLTEDVKAQVAQEVDSKLGSNVFQTQLKQFDPKSGNYDTKHERALNRLVSGLPPAIFLANDAYNLSRMMDDDPDEADKEKKIRFRQEVSRILTSGYLTLITMGAFQSFINKSKAGIMLMTGTTVLITEMFSRLSNGKHIVRLTPEEARAENAKNHAPEAAIKPVEKTESNKQISSTGAPENKETAKEKPKPLLSFDTLMKASAVVLGIGYGIKGFKHIPAIKNAAMKYFKNMKLNNPEKYNKLIGENEIKPEDAVKTFEDKVLYKPFKDLYKYLTTEPFKVDPKKFEQVVDVLKEYDATFAAKYEKIGKDALKTVDGKTYIDLGNKDRKIKPLVNFIIAPFKFMWNAVTLPYWMIDEKLMNVFRKAKPKSPAEDVEALAKSFDRIAQKALKKNFNKAQFHDYLQVNFLKAFNEDSLSSVSNAELSNLAKTAASIATIWFLMTDNYNMVMLKSNGNDKEGASTKFKERFVQESSRLFYQTLLIDLFNSTFRNQYNSTLLGMSWVTLADTTLGEILTRKSVGTPCRAHTRDELIAIEAEQNNSKGFKKKYYNFMQRLTGKRAIKTYEVDSKNKPQTTSPAAMQTPLPNIPSLNNNKPVIFQQVMQK